MSDARFDEFEVLFRIGVVEPGERDLEGEVVTDLRDPGLIILDGLCCGLPPCELGDDGFVTFAVATIVPLFGEFSFGFGDIFRGGIAPPWLVNRNCPSRATFFALSPRTSLSCVCF